jgi:hypothetical protein
MLFSISCKKERKEEISFYKLNDRIGLWVNSARGDTLEFLDSNNLIRHYSFFIVAPHFLYRIDGNNLLVQEASSLIETQHRIIDTDLGLVHLGNMYLSFGFEDNSGTFKKID